MLASNGCGRGAAVQVGDYGHGWWAWPGRCRGRWRRSTQTGWGPWLEGACRNTSQGGVRSRLKHTIAMDSFLGEVRGRDWGQSQEPKEGEKTTGPAKQYGQMGSRGHLWRQSAGSGGTSCYLPPVTPRTFENSDSPWLELGSPGSFKNLPILSSFLGHNPGKLHQDPKRQDLESGF